MMVIRDEDSFEYFAYFSSALCVISPLLAGKAGGLVHSVWICEWLAGRSKLDVDTQFQTLH